MGGVSQGENAMFSTRSRSKKFIAGSMATMLALVQVLTSAQTAFAWTQDPTDDPTENHHSLICKMTGTPGVNEVLQTGDNPVSRDRKAGDQVGTLFNDGQNRSYVLGFAKPGERPEPTVAECLAMAIPSVVITAVPCTGTTGTESVTVQVTNRDQIIGNSVVYTVTVGSQTKQTAALGDGVSQTVTFAGLAVGTHTVTVAALGGTVYTGSVIVGTCVPPLTTTISVPAVPVLDTCGVGNAVYGEVPAGSYTVVRNADGSITLTAAANTVFRVVDGYIYSHDNTVVTIPAPSEENTAVCPEDNLVINKLDAEGNLLSGAVFGGESCTKWDNDLNWQCQDLREYTWFSEDFTKMGTTGNNFAYDIPMRDGVGTTCADSQHYVKIWELTAPEGYIPLSRGSYLKVCLTQNGWVLGENTMGSDANVVSSEANVSMNVVNHLAPTPVENQMPLVKKVDQDGKPLNGMIFGGWSCTKWDNDLNWQCQDLSEYGWTNMEFTSSTDGLQRDISIRGTLATSCEDTDHVLILFEDTAPAGYAKAEGVIILCNTVDGWKTATKADFVGLEDEGQLTDMFLNHDGRIYYAAENNTVVFVNNKIGRGGGSTIPTPPAKSSNVAVATVATELPHTGAAGSGNIVIVIVATILTYGVVYFAQPRRRTE